MPRARHRQLDPKLRTNTSGPARKEIWQRYGKGDVA